MFASLPIKLELKKDFVKAMDKYGDDFCYLKQKFSKINDAKIKERIFIGPQIRNLLAMKNLNKNLKRLKKPHTRVFEILFTIFFSLGFFSSKIWGLLATKTVGGSIRTYSTQKTGTKVSRVRTCQVINIGRSKEMYLMLNISENTE